MISSFSPGTWLLPSTDTSNPIATSQSVKRGGAIAKENGFELVD
jgi:hypothetical protein